MDVTARGKTSAAVTSEIRMWRLPSLPALVDKSAPVPCDRQGRPKSTVVTAFADLTLWPTQHHRDPDTPIPIDNYLS